MAVVWPFCPLPDMTELLEWSTDVIETISNERRIALRDVPRRTLSMSHLLTDAEAAAARAYIREADTYLVPDWTRGINLGPLTAGSMPAPFALPSNYYGLAVGDAVLIRQSNSLFEQTTVAEIDSNNNRILGDIDRDYDNASVYPLLTCTAQNGFQLSRLGRQQSRASVNMRSYDGPDLSASYYPTYRSHPVVTDCPVIAGGLDQTISWDYDTFDAGYGTVNLYRKRDLPNLTYSMRWVVTTQPELIRLRRFLYRCSGQRNAFWLSSRAIDLELRNDIGDSDTTINVQEFPGLTGLGRDSAFDIEIVALNGNIYRRQVTSQTAGPGGSRTLNIVTSIGETLAVSDVKRISFLHCGRLTSDQVALSHIGPVGIRVSVGCKEVPVPT